MTAVAQPHIILQRLDRGERQWRGKRQAGLAAVHETAAGLHRLNIIDAATMRAFDAMPLTLAEKLAPDEIRAARASARWSDEPVFAHDLNVSRSIPAGSSRALYRFTPADSACRMPRDML